MRTNLFIACVLTGIGASQLPAQKPCSGPGASFGVTSYQCASCGIDQKPGQRMEFVFHAEPLILQTSSWSALRQGDVIEAVNDKPITTRAGAELFTYPSGATQIMVRRNGSRVVIGALPSTSCPVEVEDATGVARSVSADSLTFKLRPDSNVPAGSFGFTLTCNPSCTRARASNGVEYWRFDGPPSIGVVDPEGSAARAGLKVGDVVLEIDGRPVLEEAGALRLLHAGWERSLRLKVRHVDGKEAGYTLKAPSVIVRGPDIRPCAGTRVLVVRNEVGRPLDVYWQTAGSPARHFLATAAPGRTSWPLPPMTKQPNFLALDPNSDKPSRVVYGRGLTYVVECH